MTRAYACRRLLQRLGINFGVQLSTWRSYEIETLNTISAIYIYNYIYLYFVYEKPLWIDGFYYMKTNRCEKRSVGIYLFYFQPQWVISINYFIPNQTVINRFTVVNKLLTHK